MRRIWTISSLRPVLFLVGIVGLLLMTPSHTAGQDIVDDECFDLGTGCDVEGFSAILASTDASEIDTDSETAISFDLQDNDFAADVVGHLLLNDPNNEIDTNEGFDDGTGLADATMSDGVEVGNAYGLLSDHNVDDLLTGDVNLIGQTFVAVDASAPQIDSIDPPDASTETQGTLTINGSNLFDPFTLEIRLIYPDPSVTFSLNSVSADGTQIVLNYSIAANATTGDQNLALETRFGESNLVIFHVGDPTPVVTSVSPSEWQAGTDTSIAIGGKFFGCNPSLSISGPGVTGSSISSSSDTQIQGTVTIDASSSGGTATVTVTSHGCTGQGFVRTTPGESDHGNDTANINAAKPPPPQVLYFGNPIASQQAVTVGQQINLGFKVQLSGNLSVTSQTWTVSGTAIASFTPGSTTQGDQVTQMAQTLTDPTVTFYWLNTTGSPQVTLSYCANNGQCSDSVTASLNLSAPTSVKVNVTPTDVTTQVSADADTPGSVLIYEDDQQNPGIKFFAQASLPSGQSKSQYQWLQLQNTDQDNYILAREKTCTFFSGGGSGPQLDTAYPYGNGKNVTTNKVTNDVAFDVPLRSLPPTDGEWRVKASYTMNLRWIPSADSACNAGTACTIPVPMGSINWSWSGCAINALSEQDPNKPGLTWLRSCHNHIEDKNLTTPDFGKNFGYPQWSATNSQTCN